MMLRKLLPLLLCAVMLLASLGACSKAWEGYDSINLSQYLTLGTYKGVSYTKTDVTVTDEDVTAEIDAVRADNMVKAPLTDRLSQKNDYVVIDYTTKVEAGTISALSGTDKTFAVGSSYTLTTIPGFSESLIGHSQGDTYVFELTFPADYTNADISDITLVAGKAATVEVVIDSLFEYVKPDLTDEFVAKVSTVSKTVEEYREEIRAKLTEQAEAEALSAMQEEVWTAVVDGCEVKKYPEGALEVYRTEMQEYYEEYAAYYGYTFEEFLTSAYGYTLTEFEQKKEEYAQSSVLSDMVLHAIADAEGITVTDEEYKAGLTKYFEMTGSDLGLENEAAFEAYYTAEVIRESVLWDEVIGFLCEQAVGVEGTAAETDSETE